MYVGIDNATCLRSQLDARQVVARRREVLETLGADVVARRVCQNGEGGEDGGASALELWARGRIEHVALRKVRLELRRLLAA